ncbi:hypothetical protein ACFLSJ_00030 [Verrucomicrobiota bacterium]
MKQKQSQYEQLIFRPTTYGLKEFEELGRRAGGAGFTHLYISWLRDRSDYGGDDADSPWCEWSVLMPSLFKHVRLKGLEQAFPAAWIKRQADWMQRKHEICGKLGLRAAYFGMEPHWLSNRVYEQHPEWRGSRCDNSLRTTGLFFAPNVDHPEMQALYHEAARRVAKMCPLIDTFLFHTNDAGGGFIWSKKAYVNPNGPTGYEAKDMGLRVTEFMHNIRAGALAGGVKDPHVFMPSGPFTPEETKLINRSITPGVGVQGRLQSDDPALVRDCSVGHAGTWRDGDVGMDPMYRSFPNPFGVLDAANGITSGEVARFQTAGCSRDYFEALKLALDRAPARTQPERLAALRHMAAGMYGEDVADDVVEAWYVLKDAATEESMSGADTFAGVMLRWLTRPLVAHQELLTDEEKDYWIKPIYQSEKADPDTWMSYGNVVGYPSIYGWPDATFVAVRIDRTEGTLQQAAAMLKAAAEKAKKRAAKKRLMADYHTLRVHRCVLLTARHFGQMHALIQLRDEHLKKLEARGEIMTCASQELPDLPHGSMGSHGLFYMHRTMRWELDNTNELIRLLEEAPEPVFFTVDAAREGSLVLGPDLIGKLKKKVAIMMKYWRTAEQGYYRPTLGG